MSPSVFETDTLLGLVCRAASQVLLKIRLSQQLLRPEERR